MHEVLQFILSHSPYPLYTQLPSVSADAAQGTAFLYPGLELSVYFLQAWNSVLIELCRTPAQFMKQGRCRMAGAPVSSVFYKIVS